MEFQLWLFAHNSSIIGAKATKLDLYIFLKYDEDPNTKSQEQLEAAGQA